MDADRLRRLSLREFEPNQVGEARLSLQVDRVVGLVAGVVSVIAGLLAISDRWDKVERFAEWIYPLGVIALLAIYGIVVSGLYVRELARPFKALMPSRADRKRRASERQKINLIKGEIAGNRRLLESGVGKQQIVQTTTDEYWVAHRLSLPQIHGADAAYALCLEAYERFAEIDDAVVRRHEVSDDWLRAVAEKATRRSAISPDDQRFTLRCVRRTISSIDSQGLVDSSVRFRLPWTPSRVRVSVSSRPSRSEPAAPG